MPTDAALRRLRTRAERDLGREGLIAPELWAEEEVADTLWQADAGPEEWSDLLHVLRRYLRIADAQARHRSDARPEGRAASTAADPGEYVTERGRAADALRGYPRAVQGPFSWSDEPPVDLELSTYRDGEYHSRRLTLTADLWVPAGVVASMYRTVQAGHVERARLQHRHSPRTMAMVRFTVEHPREGRTYPQLVDEWNRQERTTWAYADYRRFRRDYLAAQALVPTLLAPYH